MEYRDGFFKGVRGIQTYYQCWIPEGDLKAALIVVHGLAEHSGRYMNMTISTTKSSTSRNTTGS